MDSKSVINWVKEVAKQIQNIIKVSKKPENVELLELDEMCTILKKSNKLWIWTAVERKTKEIKRILCRFT